MTQTVTSNLLSIVETIDYWQIIQAMLLVVAGIVLARLVSLAISKLLSNHVSKHFAELSKRAVKYIILILFFMAALQQLGFSLSLLIGAAGILTVAIGFASQLSVSNLISGLFLIAEQPFRVGETISVSGITGEVLAIDALSIRVRTEENTLARIPNETLIKTTIINLSRLPLRRFDLVVGVNYNSDSDLVKKTLLAIANNSGLILKNPAPFVRLIEFADCNVSWRLSVFAANKDYSEMKSQLHEAVLTEFAKQNIDMPFPIQTIQIAAGAE